jgi:hypothetical protein
LSAREFDVLDQERRGSCASCSGCEREIPLSEAVVPEASDYVAYFCGLECYARWHSQAERYLVGAVG